MNYIYKAALPPSIYHGIYDNGKHVKIKLPITKKKLKQRRKEKTGKVFGSAIGVLSMFNAAFGGGKFTDAVIDANKSFQGVQAALTDNPIGVFYTNDNQIINIDKMYLDIKDINVYDNGQEIEKHFWTDEIVGIDDNYQRILNTATQKDSLTPHILCYIVSSIPPEIVHQFNYLPIGMITQNEDDARALAGAKGFGWLDDQYKITSISKLIDAVPNEMLHNLNPQNLNIKDHNLTNIYNDMKPKFDKLQSYTLEEIEKGTTVFEEYSKKIPLLSRVAPKQQDKKFTATDNYLQDAKKFKEALKKYYTEKNLDVEGLRELFDINLFGQTVYQNLERLNDGILKTITADAIFENTNINLSEKDKKELVSAEGRNINAYREKLLEIIHHYFAEKPYEYLAMNKQLIANMQKAVDYVYLIEYLPVEEVKQLMQPNLFSHVGFSTVKAHDLLKSLKSPKDFREAMFSAIDDYLNAKDHTQKDVLRFIRNLNVTILYHVLSYDFSKESKMNFNQLEPQQLFKNVELIKDNEFKEKLQTLEKSFENAKFYPKTVKSDAYAKTLAQTIEWISFHVTDKEKLYPMLLQIKGNINRYLSDQIEKEINTFEIVNKKEDKSEEKPIYKP